NSKDDSCGTRSTGIDPNYKTTFKQVFDTKPSAIAEFLDIYETNMRCVPMNLRENTSSPAASHLSRS
ncbi:hypothetical protein DSO57_1024923, partial [Entomophthora muscae]